MVVVGGSIAGVTAAGTLRAEGFGGDITVLSDEAVAPYSRVPLSKGILAGTQDPATAALGALPSDVTVCCATKAKALHRERRLVELGDGSYVPYDGLVIATGSRARRLAAPDQAGELVIRTMSDAQAIAERLIGARTAIVIGSGFLGMEVASTLCLRGLSVTVVNREPPLRRLIGRWLANLVVSHAVEHGIRFLSTSEEVRLLGDPVEAVEFGSTRVSADVVISAVGDVPNTEWLESLDLSVSRGVVVDERCRVAEGIVAAGDVTAHKAAGGGWQRSPYWTNAVDQGRVAARSLLDPAAQPYRSQPYFWTEQFGMSIKIAGQVPLSAAPKILDGDLDESSVLAQWDLGGSPIAAAAINYRLPIVRLKALSGAQ
ncbi:MULTISPECIES: NAD(P)/FAD-dependent oxidoreductase [unclassified Mycolicibacterium]|uniref:NAD(P)/FAD-dependent oxidoreductase n=1 Tax=unclassified Mycolicibacterium TaxID=2636767 RepID=UPI002EDBABAF